MAALLAHRFFGLGLEPGRMRDLLVVLAFAPILEEWVLRPGLQDAALRRWGREHGANGVVALVFVAMHAPAAGAWAVLWLVPGLALGELWRRGRRLGLNMAMHAWFNACLWWASGPGA